MYFKKSFKDLFVVNQLNYAPPNFKIVSRSLPIVTLLLPKLQCGILPIGCYSMLMRVTGLLRCNHNFEYHFYKPAQWQYYTCTCIKTYYNTLLHTRSVSAGVSVVFIIDK